MRYSDENMVPICSVRQMAAKLNISSQRLYQLVKIGIFPPPVYCIWSKKPFYTFEIERVCLKIKKEGLGLNGKVTKFNTKRINTQTKARSVKRTANYNEAGCSNLCYEISMALRNKGINISAKEIKDNFNNIFPHGVKDFKITGESIIAVFRYFREAL
jgi:hypothetical protein